MKFAKLITLLIHQTLEFHCLQYMVLFIIKIFNIHLVNHSLLQTSLELCELRTPQKHNENCALIENSEDPSYNSTTYGITEQCAFNSLQHYHTCNFGLPPDTMHDLLEGYIKLCTNLLLKQFIETEKYFKLSDINNAIQNFKYGPSEAKCKPNIITTKEMSHQHSTLNQSGKY